MKKNTTSIQENREKTTEPKPNEHGGVHFSSHIKISDPNTKEVLVEKRGDN